MLRLKAQRWGTAAASTTALSAAPLATSPHPRYVFPPGKGPKDVFGALDDGGQPKPLLHPATVGHMTTDLARDAKYYEQALQATNVYSQSFPVANPRGGEPGTASLKVYEFVKEQDGPDAPGTAETPPEFAAEFFTQIMLVVSCHDIADIWVAFFSRCQRYRC